MKSGSTAQTDPAGKEFAMNLHFSGWEWLRVATSLLFILLVVALLACIGFVISNLCYHGSLDDKDKK